MKSNASAPAKAPETPNPPGFSPARKRPRGAFEGIGHILALWVLRLYRKGLLPTPRSFLLLSALADIVDVDGRWCFYHLENLAERCNGFLSVSSIKRAIDDLVELGVVRKLNRPQTLDFFAEDIARGRSVYRLPCVLELLVPAESYPEPVLAEINECRAALGEEPITSHSRPPLKPKTPAHGELGPSSYRATDSFPGDSSGNGAGGSVRDSMSTGEEERQNGPYEIIAHIHDRFLAEPQADRQRLTLAVHHLLSQGLGAREARALFSGLDRLKRPFPALMSRMRSMKAAQAFLSGVLGRGVNASGPSSPQWPAPEETEPFSRPERFLLDPQGKAPHTCPEHRSTRNEPGGTCAICGRRCRSAPHEIMHDPALKPSAPHEEGTAPAEHETQPPAVPEEELDPQLQALITASLAEASKAAPPSPPTLTLSPWKALSSGISPASRTVVDDLRDLLRANSGAPGKIPSPRTAPHDLVDDPTTSRWERTS
ncbi:MAG TPA: helix-turn-helix domain-containing protein [Candidatus Nocardiopsis merdipullorum]|nr:helix-turn-helix domain-containing protein [Candidatus Nocardiopsis merdipullorum]